MTGAILGSRKAVQRAVASRDGASCLCLLMNLPDCLTQGDLRVIAGFPDAVIEGVTTFRETPFGEESDTTTDVIDRSDLREKAHAELRRRGHYVPEE